jgi:hypothetical protein
VVRDEESRHPVQHPEARPQDGHDERQRTAQPAARGDVHRRPHLHRLDPHVARRLVGEQRHELVGQPPERRGVGPLVAQRGELVGDERVVHDEGAHRR